MLIIIKRMAKIMMSLNDKEGLGFQVSGLGFGVWSLFSHLSFPVYRLSFHVCGFNFTYSKKHINTMRY